MHSGVQRFHGPLSCAKPANFPNSATTPFSTRMAAAITAAIQCGKAIPKHSPAWRGSPWSRQNAFSAPPSIYRPARMAVVTLRKTSLPPVCAAINDDTIYDRRPTQRVIDPLSRSIWLSVAGIERSCESCSMRSHFRSPEQAAKKVGATPPHSLSPPAADRTPPARSRRLSAGRQGVATSGSGGLRCCP